MTTETLTVIVGALAMPLSGIVGAYLTYRALNKSTKETTVTNLLTAAHGASKDLIAQLSAELIRLREQMNENEEHYGSELQRMAAQLETSNAKIAKLTLEVEKLTIQRRDYERVVQERDTLAAELASLRAITSKRKKSGINHVQPTL